MYPYYKHDIDAGIMDNQSILEIIESLWFKFSMRLFIWRNKTVPSSSQASQLDLILQLVVRMKTEKL